jgi:glyoxylase-like metal-dependent hydrolase (beta-lactamase superfamily II)
MGIKNIKLGLTNCFLIPLNSKCLLVDTGYEWEWKTFQKRLNDVNVRISDIGYLLLTHHHDDHSGLINNLVESNPQIKIIAYQKAKDYLKLGENVRYPGQGYINKRVGFILGIRDKIDKKWAQHAFPAFDIREKDILINEDTNVKDIGININGKVIVTPGHTDDSISLVLDDGSCFCGDAAANFPQFAGTKYCVIIINDLEEYYRSWVKILNENPRIIYPAHGKPFKAECLQKNLYKNKKENIVLLKYSIIVE